MIDKIKVLGKEVGIVIKPQQGAFEPDYEVFYKEISDKSVELKSGNIIINISAHFDFNIIITVRVKSLGSQRYSFEYMLDTEILNHLKHDPSIIDNYILEAFNDFPDVQKSIEKRIDALDYSPN